MRIVVLFLMPKDRTGNWCDQKLSREYKVIIQNSTPDTLIISVI